MNKIPSEIKVASTILIVLGILIGLILIPLTLFSGPQLLSWIYTISPSLILICFLIVTGIGVRYAKRWAWWITQIILLMLSFSFLRFIVEGFFSYKGQYNTPPPTSFIILILIVFTVIYLLFSKNAMLYFKFEELGRPKIILKAFIISAIIVMLLIVSGIILNTYIKYLSKLY